jgi:hypothetical protein
VRLSAAIAAALMVYQDRLGDWRPILGPETGDYSPSTK